MNYGNLHQLPGVRNILAVGGGDTTVQEAYLKGPKIS